MKTWSWFSGFRTGCNVGHWSAYLDSLD